MESTDHGTMFAFEADPLPTTASAVSTAAEGINSQYPAEITGGIPKTFARQDEFAGEELSAVKKKQSSRRRKKKALDTGPAALPGKLTRGFDTPCSTLADESDVSAAQTPYFAPSRGPGSLVNSPRLQASALTRALSNLKLNGNGHSLSRETSLTGSTFGDKETSSGTSEADCSETATYSIPITRDFASVDNISDSPPADKTRTASSMRRKMTASDFEPLKCLGKGAFGTVVLVKQISTGRLFAQKQLKKASITVHERLIEQTKSERTILENVNRHPFVVKLFYAFQDHARLYLILEYAQGGELFHHLALERTFSEEVSAFYMAELVIALDHLHRDLGVVYRDLKPENCLLDAEGHLLLTDFGLSKIAVDDDEKSEGNSTCNSILGTIDYMAPEVVQGKPYTAAVDWWSLGALGFDLLTGAPPFASNNHTKTQQKIVHGKLALPYYLSPDAKDLLTRLLRKEPKKRLGGNMPKDLATIQSHRFFRRIHWQALRNREMGPPIQPIITDPAAAENFDVEFTDLALSPTEMRSGNWMAAGTKVPGDNLFTNFSYVASQSLLETFEF